MRLVTSLMNFECQPCGIFKGLSHHQEDESMATNTFAASLCLGHIIKKLVSSTFMGMVVSISVIFDTVSNYSYSSNKRGFLKLE